MLLITLTIFAIIFIYSVCEMIWCWLFLSKYSSKSPLLKPLTLKAYAYYYRTLHIDYYLIGFARLILYTLRKILWRRGLAKEKSSYATQIAEVFLDTSLMLYMRPGSFDAETKEAIFYVKEFCAPNDFAEAGYVLIKDLEVKINLERREAIECKLGSKDISMQLCLRLMIWLYCANIHVQVHYFGTKACDLNHVLPEIQIATIYTIAINTSAIQGAPIFMHTRLIENQAKMFSEALTKPFPKHTAQDLKVLEPYSQTCTFLIKSREAIFSVLPHHGINLNPEAFFLQTVMHSIDHVFLDKAVDALSLIADNIEDQKVCADGDMVFALFAADLAPIFANTKLYASKVTWHRDLYAKLAQINPSIAKYVDWCIAY